jgi:heme A synthase
MLLFINQDYWQTNKANEENEKNCTLVFLFQKKTWQGYFHRLISFGAVGVTILLPIIVFLRVSQDFIGFHNELKLNLGLFSILLCHFIRMILHCQFPIGLFHFSTIEAS